MRHLLTAQALAESTIAEAEKFRREKSTLRTTPLPDALGVPDYACSGRVMELAMAHLDESIPNGQKRRTELAFRALILAVRNHEQWLHMQGYDV